MKMPYFRAGELGWGLTSPLRSGIGFLDFLSGLWPIAAAGQIVDVLLLTALYRRSITGTPLTPATCLLAWFWLAWR